MKTFGDTKQLSTAGQQLAATATSVYATTVNDKTTEIKTILLHNTNNVPEVAQIFIGGTTAAYRVYAVTLVPNETHEFSPAIALQLLTAGTTTTMYGLSSNANKVNIYIYGRVEA
jgi:hypothetical protein